MSIINNESYFSEIENSLTIIQNEISDPAIRDPFEKDFSLRLCWSSNAIEGNTLDLDETVSLIEYDEVKSGHTYTEYREAKNLYQAIEEILVPFSRKEITEEWIKKANGIICGDEGTYRKNSVYVGTLVEASYYPPDFTRVPSLMEEFVRGASPEKKSVKESIEEIAKQHIRFEMIHPFRDGNGRTGRMLLNQQLYNMGLLPLVIEPSGKYRQAFRQFQKNGDVSLMTYILCKGELASIQRVQQLNQMRERSEEKIADKGMRDRKQEKISPMKL